MSYPPRVLDVEDDVPRRVAGAAELEHLYIKTFFQIGSFLENLERFISILLKQ